MAVACLPLEVTAMLRRSIAVLIAFVVLSSLADSGRLTRRVVAGRVVDWQEGDSISVTNDRTDPVGFRIGLRGAVYEGDPSAIRSGVRVTVWYKIVGERRPVATKVSVLADSAMN
jgi:hypothetical protein